MNSPTQLVWIAHGSPVVAECVTASGRCYVCVGELTRGTPVSEWLGTNYTDQNRARSPASLYVCEACVYVHSRTSPVLGRPAKDGKKFGANFRNVSHLYDELGYANASKGEKPAIREFLAREHTAAWFAAIADSAQKHVLPFAPMNGAGRAGCVQFDDVTIAVPEDQALIREMSSLLTAGATKEDLGSGDHGPRAWQLCGAALVQFEARRWLERGSGWFTLALWLAQRDEDAVAARMAAEKEAKNARRKAAGKTQDPDGGGAARSQGRVPRKPRSKSTQALGSTTGPDASGGPNNSEPRGVVDEDAPRSRAGRADQQRIPGID